MTISVPSLHYPSSVQEYAVSEQEYLRQHPEYDVLVTGAVVFNREGKLLLVQRAADEKAFPNFWVSRKDCPAFWYIQYK
jgi:isopentenyldiphosphate isomerase